MLMLEIHIQGGSGRVCHLLSSQVFQRYEHSHISYPILRLLPSALILDLILVGIVKAVVRRRRPSHNRMDIFATFSVDRYSFPTGHATRAAMCARFLLLHLVLATPLRVLVFLWSGLVGLSRVLLGRHNMTEVLFGFLMGYCQYNLVEMLWVPSLGMQGLLGLIQG
uniref:phospholipid phosphatase 6-like n=1 Tax=Oncorhynchus gorbuscha TaxID=8017 RepID=UPI001EAEE8A5|nr:phospholipid phosphatase 6-like [Oncorhynchus gorbuscha]